MNEITCKEITPIFVIGASRNGTTSLVNLVNTFPDVAKVEHRLHHGSHEAKLYGYYKYYDELNDIDKYIDFLYHYSSEDYFRLVKGSIDYHLKNRKTDFFQFFFDLMDRYCMLTNKRFWVGKIDSAFFTDRKVYSYFVQLVKSRYKDAKYIRIRRDLLPAVRSAQYMEGRGYQRRRKWPFKYFYLMAYTQSWFKTYLLRNEHLEREGVLDIDFNTFIRNETGIKKTISTYLGMSKNNEDDENLNKAAFQVNTSFSRKQKGEMSGMDKAVVQLTVRLLKVFPKLSFLFHYLNGLFIRKHRAPIHRKLIKFNYYRDCLMEEFESFGAFGLLDSMEDKNKK